VAGLRAAETAADARVAAAKLRLMRHTDQASRSPAFVRASAAFVRRAPLQGLAIAFLAGMGLGLAPRSTLRRLGPLFGPLVASAFGGGGVGGPPAGVADPANEHRGAP